MTCLFLLVLSALIAVSWVWCVFAIALFCTRSDRRRIMFFSLPCCQQNQYWLSSKPTINYDCKSRSKAKQMQTVKVAQSKVKKPAMPRNFEVIFVYFLSLFPPIFMILVWCLPFFSLACLFAVIVSCQLRLLHNLRWIGWKKESKQ